MSKITLAFAALQLFVLAPLFAAIPVDSCQSFFTQMEQANFPALRAQVVESFGVASDAENIQKSLESLHFVDDQHQRQSLANIFIDGKAVASAGLHKRYDTSNFINKILELFRKLFGIQVDEANAIGEFANFQRARKIFFDQPVGVDSLKAAHVQIARSLTDVPAGTYRNMHVIGNALNPGITQTEYETIIKNPYLGFKASPNQVNGRWVGQIIYPRPQKASAEVLRRLETQNPKLSAKLRELQLANAEESAFAQYYQEFIAGLVDERMAWFTRQRQQLGDPDTSEKLDTYIALVAELQRDLVAIHPFKDGNGRTTRALMYSLLEKEGLPAPRIFKVYDDIQVSLADWVSEVKSGMLSTVKLYQDTQLRMNLGLPLENSTELFTPIIPRSIKLDFRKSGSSIIIDSADVGLVDSRQFGAWLTQGFIRDRKLLLNYSNEAETLSKDYITFRRQHELTFDHPKDGIKRIKLDFVDRDFKFLFGKNLYSDSALWNLKIDQWYQREIVWRGLSYRDRKLEQPEILDIFKKLNKQMVSNRVAKGAETNLQAEVLNDFEQYNSDLLNNVMQNMARDHAETGPRYDTSYGYSTSKRREVGKAFAMGAMVVAEYGKQQEFQHLLKSRVLIGAYRGNKDVDLSRLHQFKQEFFYKYPRQAEVMGIGGAEPDSIMVVQMIDADGSVIESYVRNPQKPSEIWQVRGEFAADQGPPPAENLLATHSL